MGHTLVKGTVIPVNVSTTSQECPINASPNFAFGQHTDADCYIVTTLPLTRLGCKSDSWL